MRVLLDTNVVLRLGNYTGAVAAPIRAAILEVEKVLLSPIARAEIGIKLSVGKLTLPVTESEFWNAIVAKLQAEELEFSWEHASMLAGLPLHHKDPFDRMLASQCLSEDIHLATTDRIFARYGVKTVS